MFLFVFKLLAFGTVLYLMRHHFEKLNANDLILVFTDNPLKLSFALLAYLSIQVLLAFRWRAAIETFGITLPIPKLLNRQLLINFWELLIPVPDSEDIIKGYFMHQWGISSGKMIPILIFDRLMGLFIIFLLLPGTLFIYKNLLPPYLYITALIGFAFVFVLFVFFRRRLTVWAYLIFKRWLSDSSKALLFSAAESVIPFTSFLKVLFINILKKASAALVIFLILLSLDLNIPFLILFFTVPILQFSIVLPLSYQGLGLFETALIFILTTYHQVPADIATLAGIIHLFFNLILIFISGALFMFFKKS